jgi:hypothetical protein
MITNWQRDETIVGRLRVEGARVDPASAQLRLATLLNNAVSHLATLPPSAIVFIRKLRDPLPGSLRIQQRDFRPPLAWQQALNTKIEKLVANAARPALGAVPANAEAVVFADRSELLASLASDWCKGQLATRWWWQSLLRKTSAAQIVRELWWNAPEYVPAAVEKLSRAGEAVRFVKTFSDQETRAFLISLTRTFRLDHLTNLLDEVFSKAHADFAGAAASQGLAPSVVKAARDVHSRPSLVGIVPWNDWVRRSETSGLGPEQELFVGVALTLQRAPARVRTTEFTRAIAAWHDETLAERPQSSDPVAGDGQKSESIPQIRSVSESDSAGVEDTSQRDSNPDRASPGALFLDTAIASSGVTNPKRDDVARELTAYQDAIVDRSRKQFVVSEEPLSSSQDQLQPRQMDLTPAHSVVEHQHRDAASLGVPTEPLDVRPDHPPLTEFEVTTDFGGVFYLVNLGIYLGLYGDFTTLLEPGVDLNIWDFVALLGHELVGESLEADPVWTLLRQLSGLDEEEDLDGDSPWLEDLMPSIRARLQRALGLNDTEDPGPLLCEQRARVSVTPAHVDVFIALADLPIAIRLAGLDRDPGWVPVAGRFINFHFE